MNLLDIAQKQTRLNKTGGKHGGEYSGPCPLCGGHEKADSDRFRVWPLQGEQGTWWCRRCDRGGDAIQYLRDVEGMSYRDACAALGVAAGEQAAATVAPAAHAWTPRSCPVPPPSWEEHAEKFATAAREALQGNADIQSWLDLRGISVATATAAGLGWNDKDQWRVRTSWGLSVETKEDGTPKKLWLPRGLVIPYRGEGLNRLRIRRPEGDPRYYVVSGSAMNPYIAPRMDAVAAAVIVESELDAITLGAISPAGVVVVAMGNSSARPDTATHKILLGCKRLLVALDTDGAGASSAKWWLQQYPTAVRWPIPGHKDPGEAAAAGFDLGAWLRCGLPPVCLLPVKPEPVPAKIAPHPDTERSVYRLYRGIAASQPDGAMEWLKENRPDVIAFARVQESAMDELLDKGRDVGVQTDKVLRTWLRAWSVFLAATTPPSPLQELPPQPEEPPQMYQDELF